MARKTDKKKADKKKADKKRAVREKTNMKKAGSKKVNKKKPDKKRNVKKPAGTKKMKKVSDRKFKIWLGVGAVAACYIMLSVYFSNHFLPRTEINGYSCQFKTVEQVKEMIREGCETYQLVLKERGEKEEIITADQVDLQFVDDNKIDRIQKEQNHYGWILALFDKPLYENAATITYDEDAFLNAVESLECLKKENTKEPKAAYPSYMEEKGTFEIVKEDPGTKVDQEVLKEQIQDALLSDLRELSLEDAGCYVKPAFYSSDTAVAEAADKMNQYLATEITYDMGYTSVKIEKQELAGWLKVDKESNVVVDVDKVEDYVDWLGKNYNTCGIRRKFKTPENTTVTVSGGTYGWRIHFQKEVDQLCEDVKTGEKITREPIYRQTGYARDKSGNDLHNTYIAISIKAQTMWYYKDGKCLLTTPVVTGNTSKKMGTPTGVYEIAFKQRDHILRGQDYESPVDYWMPFYEYRGIGIHDASWRAADAFGKEIYKTNGSHGCVNTPYEAVKTLFEIVKTGTPVVVY